MSETLNNAEFDLFNRFLEGLAGIHYERDRAYLLERGLLERMKALKVNDFMAYYKFLQSAPDQATERAHLIELLTVGETYFFRNENHFKALQEYMLPSLLRENHQLEILSAACSTGEEPYSLAMLLKEHFPHANWRIIGFDINQASLRQAKLGLFGKRSLRAIPMEYQQKYFSPCGNHFQLREDILKSVTFMQGNLNEDALFKQLPPIDLLVCRNVLIYFTQKVIQTILRHFHRVLKPHGFLLLGHSETLRGVSDQFTVQEHSQTFFYRPAHADSTEPLAAPAIKNTTRGHLETGGQSLPAFVQPSGVSSQGAIAKAPVQTTLKFSQHQHATTKHATFTKSESCRGETSELVALEHKATQTLIAEREAEVIALLKPIQCQTREHLPVMKLLALALANKGHFEEAEQVCGCMLALDDYCAEAHYILGMIHEHHSQNQQALKEYETTLFLQNNFALAHFRMASLNLALKKPKVALRAYRNTLKFLDIMPDDLIRIYSGGFNKQAIESICRQQVE